MTFPEKKEFKRQVVEHFSSILEVFEMYMNVQNNHNKSLMNNLFFALETIAPWMPILNIYYSSVLDKLAFYAGSEYSL